MKTKTKPKATKAEAEKTIPEQIEEIKTKLDNVRSVLRLCWQGAWIKEDEGKPLPRKDWRLNKSLWAGAQFTFKSFLVCQRPRAKDLIDELRRGGSETAAQIIETDFDALHEVLNVPVKDMQDLLVKLNITDDFWRTLSNTHRHYARTQLDGDTNTEATKYRVLWDDNDPNFIEKKKAIEMAHKIGNDHEIAELKNLDYNGLKTLLRRPGCPVPFMSRTKPPRGKVHRQQWQNYLKAQAEKAKKFENAVESEVVKRI